MGGGLGDDLWGWGPASTPNPSIAWLTDDICLVAYHLLLFCTRKFGSDSYTLLVPGPHPNPPSGAAFAPLWSHTSTFWFVAAGQASVINQDRLPGI